MDTGLHNYRTRRFPPPCLWPNTGPISGVSKSCFFAKAINSPRAVSASIVPCQHAFASIQSKAMRSIPAMGWPVIQQLVCFHNRADICRHAEANKDGNGPLEILLHHDSCSLYIRGRLLAPSPVAYAKPLLDVWAFLTPSIPRPFFPCQLKSCVVSWLPGPLGSIQLKADHSQAPRLPRRTHVIGELEPVLKRSPGNASVKILRLLRLFFLPDDREEIGLIRQIQIVL